VPSPTRFRSASLKLGLGAVHLIIDLAARQNLGVGPLLFHLMAGVLGSGRRDDTPDGPVLPGRQTNLYAAAGAGFAGLTAVFVLARAVFAVSKKLEKLTDKQ